MKKQKKVRSLFFLNTNFIYKKTYQNVSFGFDIQINLLIINSIRETITYCKVCNLTKNIKKLH